jgi:hypothetical protein
MNFLELLAAEYYEYIGYYVRSNIKARKRNLGGWDVAKRGQVLIYQL